MGLASRQAEIQGTRSRAAPAPRRGFASAGLLRLGWLWFRFGFGLAGFPSDFGLILAWFRLGFGLAFGLDFGLDFSFGFHSLGFWLDLI